MSLMLFLSKPCSCFLTIFLISITKSEKLDMLSRYFFGKMNRRMGINMTAPPAPILFIILLRTKMSRTNSGSEWLYRLPKATEHMTLAAQFPSRIWGLNGFPLSWLIDSSIVFASPAMFPSNLLLPTPKFRNALSVKLRWYLHDLPETTATPENRQNTILKWVLHP